MPYAQIEVGLRVISTFPTRQPNFRGIHPPFQTVFIISLGAPLAFRFRFVLLSQVGLGLKFDIEGGAVDTEFRSHEGRSMDLSIST